MIWVQVRNTGLNPPIAASGIKSGTVKAINKKINWIKRIQRVTALKPYPE